MSFHLQSSNLSKGTKEEQTLDRFKPKKHQMNTKSNEHFAFLSSLTYYDASQFIIASNQSLAKTQTFLGQKKDLPPGDSEIHDIFSMQYMKEFHQIKEFIESPNEHLPLLIKAPKNTGKKTLLCQVINHYQRHQSKTKIFIADFASVSKVYSEILYSIMVKLRITFGIKQKVQVNEEKIRRFFKYWLDVTSEQIEKDNLGYSRAEKETLCIIIEGIDQLTNSRGEKVFPEFWLPQYLPKNVRLILSGTEGEMSIEKLQHDRHVKAISLGKKVLSEKVKSKLKPQIRALLEHRSLSLFQIKTITWFLTVQENLKIAPTSTFNQIMETYIKACSSNLKENQIKSLILCLCLSKKGITQLQLRKIMRLRPDLVYNFLYMFEPLINKYEKFEAYYLITNPDVKDYIQQVYDPNMEKGPRYHEIIGKVVKKGELSIRKLEEEIHHLLMAESYFEIKEVITEIENFLVLYTPPCKYLLCNTWKILENHLNSDPVFEYNKAIESFLTHYHPKEEQLFKIIFQLSMFFREYSEFEGAKIPSFRHPLIKGDEEQLQQICVFEEMKKHNMTTDLKIVVKKNTDIKGSTFSKSKDMKMDTLYPRKQCRVPTISSQLDIDSASKHPCHQVIPLTTRQTDAIEQIQCLNLQIKQNREKFKEHYLKILKPYLKEFYIPVKKLMHNDKFVKSSNSTTEEEEDTEELPAQIPETLSRDMPSQLEKVKSTMILKNLEEYFEQSYHREQITEFYYYKEWMWIQFPWICQSLNYNFSDMIQKYIAVPTEYMSMDTELNLIKEVMKISQVSKESKSAIYENKSIELIPINPKKIKKNPRSNLRNHSVVPNPTNDQHETQPNLRLSVKPSNENKNQVIHESLNNSNIAKFQLDLSQIDQKLNSEIQKELSHRQVYDSRVLAKSRAKLNSMLNQSLNGCTSPFLTETTNKENLSTILPKIGHKLPQKTFAAQSRNKNLNSSKLNDLNSSKLNESKLEDDPKRTRLLTELNGLLNQNQHLKSMIEKIQKTSLMLDNINDVPQNQQLNKKLEELRSVKEKLQKKQQTQSLLKQKLETIIKICDNNKSHEMQSQLLCTFLDNLKAMCGIEEKQKQAAMKDFVTFTQKSRDQINALLIRKHALLTELKEFGSEVKLLTERNAEDDDEMAQVTLKNFPSNGCLLKRQAKVSQRAKIQKVTISSKHQSSVHSFKKSFKQRNRTILRQTNKTSSNLKYNKSELPAIWEELSSIFQFDPSGYEQSVQNSQYLTEEFQEKMTKFRELSFMYEELAYEGDSLDDRIENLEEELDTMRQKNEARASGQRGNRGSISECSGLKEKMKHLEEVKKRSAILEECMKKYGVEV